MIALLLSISITAQWPDAPPPWPDAPAVRELPPSPRLTPAIALLQSGMQFPGANAAHGPLDAYLMAEAQAAAETQARLQRQGHHDWNARYQRYAARYGTSLVSEIAAETWRDRPGETILDSGQQIWESWRQSPGHWKVASQRHSAVGAGMARGTNGVYYAAIIAVNAKRQVVAPQAGHWERRCENGVCRLVWVDGPCPPGQH